MSKLSDGCIDLTVTSPPYDNLREYNGKNNFQFEKTAQELYRLTKKGGVLVWIAGDATIKGSETGTSFRQALYFKELGFNLYDTMIYQKSGFNAPPRNRYYPIFEYMFVLTKGKPSTVHLIADRKNTTAGKKISGRTREKDGSLKIKNRVGEITPEYGVRFNIWRYSTGYGHCAENPIAHKHPAIFPLKLAEDHIKSWSELGDTVLDCFFGSGTTAVAAMKLNRNFIGYEIDEQYYKLAEERLKSYEKILEQSRT